MPKYLLDFEVESHAALVPGRTELRTGGKPGGVEVHVSVARASPGEESTKLNVQLILEEKSIAEARDRGLDAMKEFLRAWTFVTNMPFRISVFRRVVDWTPGLRERECIQFSYHSGFDRPFEALDDEELSSATRIFDASLSQTLRRAIRWHANGVSSQFTHNPSFRTCAKSRAIR